MAICRILGAGLGVVLLASCGGQGGAVTPAPSTVAPTVSARALAACQKAIEADYAAGYENTVWPPATYKPVCARIDKATILQLMDQALDDLVRSAPPGGTPRSS